MATFPDSLGELGSVFDSLLRQAPISAGIPLDLYRKGDTFIARMDLPGADPASIDIDIEDQTLTISASRSLDVEGDDVRWLIHERPTGAFARQIGLGRGLALDDISAEYTDGVLTLTIPVAEEAKPRKINVEVKKQIN